MDCEVEQERDKIIKTSQKMQKYILFILLLVLGLFVCPHCVASVISIFILVLPILLLFLLFKYIKSFIYYLNNKFKIKDKLYILCRITLNTTKNIFEYCKKDWYKTAVILILLLILFKILSL